MKIPGAKFQAAKPPHIHINGGVHNHFGHAGLLALAHHLVNTQPQAPSSNLLNKISAQLPQSQPAAQERLQPAAPNMPFSVPNLQNQEHYSTNPYGHILHAIRFMNNRGNQQ